jgi:uncharacterized membrane protein
MNQFLIAWTVWCVVFALCIISIHLAFRPAFRAQAEDHARRREALRVRNEAIEKGRRDREAWERRRTERAQ